MLWSAGGEPNFLLAFTSLLGLVLLDSGCDELDALGSFLFGVPVGNQPINESRGLDSGHAGVLHWIVNLLPGCDPRPLEGLGWSRTCLSVIPFPCLYYNLPNGNCKAFSLNF